MAAIGNTYLTLADLYKRQDPNKQIATVMEMLAQNNPILQDAIAVECNNGTKHLTTMRTGIPTPTWRKINGGVQPGKSTTKQVEAATGMMEQWSEIDAKLVDLSKDKGSFLLSEATAFIEGMNQEAATGIFYHNTKSAPEKMDGLSAYFSDTSAENGQQIVSAAGAGSDNTSIWMVVWSPATCHLVYPEGTVGGLKRENKGVQTKTNSDGSLIDVYREKFCWDIGLAVRDWRYVSRVANIDVSAMQADPTDVDGSGNDLYHFLRKAYYKLHQRRIPNGKAAIYCNTEVLEALDALGTNNGGSDNFVRLKPMELEGKEVMSYRGIPIRECDAILNTEAVVS